ncbi:hypothetical protein [Agromyces aerolatus]|uniref:hypothetical protein n=1 Tax=Agromyces sp. LY-1074 TaxID=3074080 RepID=UPI00285E0727|nr:MULTISPECIES: hypothetical protein [unclassified Agromyces]MDR5699091.1 hypothetical protein [Agromyces sp. LY-1074]MDR5705131.1 hypothetical protein [Agromyces sp. LY-1358]
MSIALAATATALAALAPLTSLPAVPETDDSVHATWRTATVEGPVIQLGWLASANIPVLTCPDSADTLDGHEYHPGSGWRIPPGVELRTGGDKIDASIMYAGYLGDGSIVRRDQVGGWHSAVTNWKLADSWV